MIRGEINEKRAIALFSALGAESDKNPQWTIQPEHVKDVFREAASFNTYKHVGTGAYYYWTTDHSKCAKFMEI